MKKIPHIVKGLRLSVSIPAGMLVHIGYRLIGQKTEWLLVAVVIVITGLVMLQNDYFDRNHDVQKGKTFAMMNEIFLRKFLIISWFILLVFCLIFLSSGFLPLYFIVGIGIGYSFFRKILLLPAVTVAFLSAMPVVLPSFPHYHIATLLMFIAVIFSIFGREMIKDMEDTFVDRDYKQTLLSADIISERTACYIAGGAIAVGGLVSIVPASHLLVIPKALYMSGICLLTTSVFFLFHFRSGPKGKEFFDGGMFCILTAFSL